MENSGTATAVPSLPGEVPLLKSFEYHKLPRFSNILMASAFSDSLMSSVSLKYPHKISEELRATKGMTMKLLPDVGIYKPLSRGNETSEELIKHLSH